jgi:hypothetical protein
VEFDLRRARGQRFDVVANEVTINPERKQKYDLSEPYSVGEGVIVTRADDNSVKSLDDIKGKVAGETATSNWAQVARDHGARVEAVEGFTQAIKLLNQGRVDLVINDSIAVYAYLAEPGDTSVKIAAHTPVPGPDPQPSLNSGLAQIVTSPAHCRPIVLDYLLRLVCGVGANMGDAGGGKKKSSGAGLGVDVRVLVYPDTDHEGHGVVVDDFDEMAGSPVEIGGKQIVGPARRWAVMLDDGVLVFANSNELRVE